MPPLAGTKGTTFKPHQTGWAQLSRFARRILFPPAGVRV